MTDLEVLAAMLGKARAMHDYQRLVVTREDRRLLVTTGPDDAGVAFWFSVDGEVLESVSVTEAWVGREVPDG